MSDRRMQPMRDDRRRERDDGDRDRRRLSRSRSPAHRGGGRRDDREGDAYSSHRGYREREREDRYGRGGGGGRGDWDRDRRGGRREGERRRDDRRRDFGDRHDRRGDRGDDRDGRNRRDDRDHRLDREDERQLERQGRRSRSPAVRKPKEPTPDLTEVTPILTRKRRLQQWDIKPQGYEKISAEQAKLSGMFPLPGAPRPQPMDASKLQAFMSQPGNSASSSALKAGSARQSKQLFVYNLPASTTVENIIAFFNLQLNGLNVTRGVDPCISANLSPDQSYALLEFRTPEDATNAMALDGIQTEANNEANGESNGTSKGLEIKRPKDYIVPTVTDETENEAGILSGIVPDTQNKISITNIPVYLTDDQIQELLVSFGELKNFVLVKDTSSGQSRGIAFCEYKDAANATPVAVESLDGMELGNSLLKVRRASIGIQQVSSEMTVNALSMMAGTSATGDTDAGRVLCLINMITPQELMDPDEADEILDDVKEECAKYGQILEVKMPRPTGPSRQNNGVGKIYIKYAESASAQKALAALAGRKFSDRTVVVTFYGEEYFDVNAW